MGLSRIQIFALLLALDAAAAPPWNNGPALNVARSGGTATLLADGRVLATGGFAPLTATAEVFDPAANAWTPTAPMSVVRFDHAAVVLPDATVLVCGGWSNGETSSCEKWNPIAGTWSAAQSMQVTRREFTLTLLPNGRVLAAGGYNPTTQAVASAELYDPGLNQWTLTPAMGTARRLHVTVVLPDAGVLAIAGRQSDIVNLAAVDAYNLTTNTWAQAASLNQPRALHDAVVLSDGTVLVAGGGNTGSASEAERFSGGAWTATQLTSTGHFMSTSTALLDGGVLLVAGIDSQAHALCEVYDPATNGWTNTGALTQLRYNHRAVLLRDGRVMVIGGQTTTSTALTSTELYGQAMPIVDAGVDGGGLDAGGLDAGGLDAGDAGGLDAGGPDGGGPDGGGLDAGALEPDGGGGDAGSSRFVTVGCGCSSPGPGLAWPLLGLLALRWPRRRVLRR